MPSCPFRLFALFVLVGFACAPSVLAAQRFPLVRNGDFRLRHGNRPHMRQSWIGGHTMKLEPAESPDELPCVLMDRGNGAIHQDLWLVPGAYVLSVEVGVSPNGKAKIRAGDAVTEQGQTSGWKRVSVKFACRDEPVRITLDNPAGAGEVRFRDVRVEAEKLTTGLVPVMDGEPLGRIVLPADPEPAEAYAAWELQYFIWRMTGRAPGLDGRDEVFPGRVVFIGRAAKGPAVEALKRLKDESYVVAGEDSSLVLTGKITRGTLYAVYDFLKAQGCRWYMPGKLGEVVPRREKLALPSGARVETPDWGEVRGILAWGNLYRHRGWVYNLGDDIFDWAVRNRINAIWHGGKYTDDLGAHRGGSYIARINHSWGSLARTGGGHPEWRALVRGKRMRLNPTSGRRNQPCTSNPDYRDAVVEIVLKYFEENPDAGSYAVSPDDGPGYWCECKNCRAQDPDCGKGKWESGKRGEPPMPMTDRALHFVNEVAERVSKVYPDKLIEMYSYQMTGFPPTRSKVHPNVLIKITYRSFGPARHSLADTTIHHNSLVTKRMDGFAEPGTKHFGLYDYGSYKNPDCPIFWFFPIVDSLKVLHEKWGFEHYLGETDNTFGPSMMAYNLRAQALWDGKIDYRREIEDICRRFYGPAAEEMFEYNLFMHDAMLNWELTEPDRKGRMFAWIGQDYAIVGQYSLPTMVKGQKILDRAAAKVRGDETLEARISVSQFGHSLFTLYVAQQRDPQTPETINAAKAAHERVMSLLGTNGNLVLGRTRQALVNFRPEPLVERTLAKLPLVWAFRKDPNDIGLDAKWYLPDAQRGEEWSEIRTDKHWSEQGHSYRGAAWYCVDFTVPAESRAALREALEAHKAVLLFGAVDGTADLFLDGKKIGKQKIPPAAMWDKAFVIPLPTGLDPAAQHCLVVRVEKKSRGGAGIWKPVSVVVAE